MKIRGLLLSKRDINDDDEVKSAVNSFIEIQLVSITCSTTLQLKDATNHIPSCSGKHISMTFHNFSWTILQLNEMGLEPWSLRHLLK